MYIIVHIHIIISDQYHCRRFCRSPANPQKNSNQVTLLRISAALHSIGRRHRQGAIAVFEASGHGVHTGDLQRSTKLGLFFAALDHQSKVSIGTCFDKQKHEIYLDMCIFYIPINNVFVPKHFDHLPGLIMNTITSKEMREHMVVAGWEFTSPSCKKYICIIMLNLTTLYQLKPFAGRLHLSCIPVGSKSVHMTFKL